MSMSINGVDGQIVCACCGACSLQTRLVMYLEKLAAEWMKIKGKILTVTSCYRCSEHNKKVGGAKNSRHMLGQAADCSVKPADQEEFIALAKKIGFGGIGIGQTFVHVDVRSIPCEPWHYTTRVKK